MKRDWYVWVVVGEVCLELMDGCIGVRDVIDIAYNELSLFRGHLDRHDMSAWYRYLAPGRQS